MDYLNEAFAEILKSTTKGKARLYKSTNGSSSLICEKDCVAFSFIVSFQKYESFSLDTF